MARDLLQDVEHQIAQGKAVSGADLLGAIEQSLGRQLGDRLRGLVCKFNIPEVKRRGRPHSFDAKMDLAFDKLDRRYPALLRYEARQVRKTKTANVSNRASASERAYERLRNHMNDDFGFFSCWETLKNKHCEWKHGRLHSMKTKVDSEDFDAEIERQFPAPKS